MRKKNKKLILISLNEINFEIVEKYVKKYNFDNLKSLIDNKKNYYTTSSENEYEKLEPWIQWVSAYTGLSADDHKIFRLGDVTNKSIEQIFEKIENLNLKVGAISPMNVSNKLQSPSFFIPDPWTQTNSDGSFWSNIIKNVLIKTVNQNVKNKISLSSYISLILIFLRFVRFKNYLSFIYLFTSSSKNKWRKAIFLDLLINEIHIKFLKKFSPNFSNIFFNAGAHIQHHYFLKSIFLKNENNKLNDKSDPIYDSLYFYNKILSDYIFNDSYDYIIFTGLTQTPNENPTYYYRLKDHKNFLSKLNINFKALYPRMSRDFLVEFENIDQSKIALEILQNLKTEDNIKVFEKLDFRGTSIFVTLTYNKKITDKILMNYGNKKFKLIDLVDFVAIKNGIHNEKGFLFVSNNVKNFITNSKMNVKDIHNVILNYFQN